MANSASNITSELDSQILWAYGNSFGEFSYKANFLYIGGGILVFWELWPKHVVNCEEMKLCKILSLKLKLKNDKSKFSPMMAVK